MKYSYKFPTLLTMVVDPNEVTPQSASTSPAQDHQEWRLASGDPRDPGQFKYRLHTLDIYFWTLEDARGVVETFRRILRPQQLGTLETPPSSTNVLEEISHVVQQLENVAITDPAYRNGQTRNSQNQSAALPPPPPGQPALTGSRHSPTSGADPGVRPASVKSTETPNAYAPVAYNPALPAAPEPIAHREKTPPPADAVDGTGLAAAAYADDTQAYASTHPQAIPSIPGSRPPVSSYNDPPAPPPPPAAAGGPEQYSSPPYYVYSPPPPAQTFQQTTSVASNTSQRTSVTSPKLGPRSNATSPLQRQAPSQELGFAPPPHDPNAHLYGAHRELSSPQPGLAGAHSQVGFSAPPPPPPPPPQDPTSYFYSAQGHSLPAPSPGTQIYGSPHLHKPVPHLQPHYVDYLQSHPHPQVQPPPGEYAQYDYAAQQTLQQQQQPPPPAHHHHHHHHRQHDGDGNPYEVHHQVYRPTEDEGRHKRQKSPYGQHGSGGHTKPAGKLGETAGKVDKKVGSFLKKLERRL